MMTILYISCASILSGVILIIVNGCNLLVISDDIHKIINVVSCLLVSIPLFTWAAFLAILIIGNLRTNRDDRS